LLKGFFCNFFSDIKFNVEWDTLTGQKEISVILSPLTFLAVHNQSHLVPFVTKLHQKVKVCHKTTIIKIYRYQ